MLHLVHIEAVHVVLLLHPPEIFGYVSCHIIQDVRYQYASIFRTQQVRTMHHVSAYLRYKKSIVYTTLFTSGIPTRIIMH